MTSRRCWAAGSRGSRPPPNGQGSPRNSAAWGAVIVLAVFTFAMLPGVRPARPTERKDLTHERARALEFGRLSAVVNRLGASHILACGQPNIPIGYQSVFAWYMGIKTGVLYVSPGYFKAHPHPLVNIYPTQQRLEGVPEPRDGGREARCHGLRLIYRS